VIRLDWNGLHGLGSRIHGGDWSRGDWFGVVSCSGYHHGCLDPPFFLFFLFSLAAGRSQDTVALLRLLVAVRGGIKQVYPWRHSVALQDGITDDGFSLPVSWLDEVLCIIAGSVALMPAFGHGRHRHGIGMDKMSGSQVEGRETMRSEQQKRRERRV